MYYMKIIHFQLWVWCGKLYVSHRINLTSILGLLQNFPVILLGYIHWTVIYESKSYILLAWSIDEQRKVSSDSKSLNICFGRSRHACWNYCNANEYNAKYCTNLNERSVTVACCSIPANSSVNDLAQKLCSKGSRSQVMLLKISMTRCCETARLSMRSFNYPIKLLVFPL